MERINKLFSETRDAEKLYRRFQTCRMEIESLEAEMASTAEEIRRIDSECLEDEIRKAEWEMARNGAEMEKTALNAMECYRIDDLKRVFARITDADVLRSKTLGYLRSLFYSAGLDCELEGVGNALFAVNKEIEELFGVIEGHPEIQKECYEIFRYTARTELQSIVPYELKVFQDDVSVFFVFSSAEPRDDCVCKEMAPLDQPGLCGYKILSHIVFGVLRENMRTETVERSLSDAEIAENNRLFEGTDFYIHNVSEWKLDVVMKEIIDMTRRTKSMEIEETGGSSDKTPSHVSAEYMRFLRCFEMFGQCASKRVEKGVRILERAILKLFDARRYDQSVYSQFVEFADVTHFLKTHPTHVLAQELSRRKEDLFFEIVRESSRMALGLEEPTMMLKLYFKEKHVDFVENLRLFVPRINQEFFEIQFFEMVNEELMKRILAFRAPRSCEGTDIASLADYVLDLSFHLPAGAVKNKERLRDYRLALSQDAAKVLDLHAHGRLHIPRDEIASLCSSGLISPGNAKLLLDGINK